MPAPRVIYQPKPGSPIDVDRGFYGRLGQENMVCKGWMPSGQYGLTTEEVHCGR